MEGCSLDKSVSASGPYRATKLWNDVILAFRRGMPVARHRRYMKTYEACCSASESVDWLHQYLRANPNFGSDVTRFQTLQLFRKLHRARVIEDVRGGKHNKHDPTDNGRLFRFTHMSPLKNRLPLAERKEITNTARHHELTKPCKPTECNSAPNNYVPAQPINPVYLHPSKYGLPPSGQCQDAPEQPPPPRPPLPVAHCQLIARQISTADTHEIWKHAALDQLQAVLNQDSLTEILDSSFVLGKNIMHNCTHLNRSGIVTNIDPKDQLPHWAMSAMRCLARWPERTDDNLPTYQGFERDVYRVVKDYFCGLSEPLMTYEMYEVVTNVFVTAEGTCHEECSGDDEDNMNPDCLTSFESVENLMLDLTNVGMSGGSRSYSKSTPESHRNLSRPISRSTIDLSPIRPIQDSFQSGQLKRWESTANFPIAKYETAFGPENRTITRVYYRDGISTDYGYSNGPEDLSKTPLETHFEMSDSYSNLLPLTDMCQSSSYSVNYAKVRSTRNRRKSAGEMISRREESRRRSNSCSTRSPASDDSARCHSLSSGNISTHELNTHCDRYEPRVRRSHVPTRSPPHYSTLFPKGRQPVLDGASKLLRKCHRSKSNASLHRIKSLTSVNCSGYDSEHLSSEATYPEQFHPSRAQSRESLAGRSLSLSDLMHAEMDKKQQLRKTRSRNSVGSLNADIKEKKKLALQIVCLLLPPASRRKLQLLLKLMSKMIDNPLLQLDDHKSTKALLMETFYRSILCSQDEADMEDLLVVKIISFLCDNSAEIMAIPTSLAEEVERRLAIASKHQIVYSLDDPSSFNYCKQVTIDQYENQRLSHSQRALVDLLEGIVRDKTMGVKDKRKRLKQFQTTYPQIYANRFPNEASELEIFPQKPKIKPPLLIKPLLKLRGLRI